MTFAQERAYVGNLSQLFQVKEYRLSGGRQEGVRAVDISTGSGLELTVLPDRCMDLYQVKFAGKNLCFHTPPASWRRRIMIKRAISGCAAFSAAFSPPAA